ncbi:MAG: formimidoylglutamase [Flavitalea sp.]
MKHFRRYAKKEALAFTTIRRFETKLGERILTLPDHGDIAELLRKNAAKFVLFGIPEDIGVRGNDGQGGADTAWTPFLSSFLNLQSNDFFTGEDILLLGHFDFSNEKFLIEQNAYDNQEKLDAYRHAVMAIDDDVEELAKIIAEAGKIAIAIGGGHNNSYPLIKGTAKGLNKADRIPLAQINCINLDAHADFNPSEGRHSGNGFRYAEEDGYLQKYCVIGLHENYLPQNVWLDIVNNPFLDIITFEDIFIHEKRDFTQALAHATGFTEDNYTGVELDLDCIQNTLSSAYTPSGISTIQARQYLNFSALHTNAAYLHICEGISQLHDGDAQPSIGKLISYLVSDFVKAYLSR